MDQKSDWDNSFDRLKKMESNPEDFEDEDIVAPRTLPIHQMEVILMAFKSMGCKSPSFITPDGDGGIISEWHSEKETIIIQAGNESENDSFRVIRDGKLIISV